MAQPHETAKHIMDITSVTLWAGALIDILPAIAALVSIVWGCVRIYETRTVQRVLGKKPRTRKDDD